MKKFIIPISIIIVMLLGLVTLTGCENNKGNNESKENENNKKAIIVNNMGETENLTSEELYNILQTNNAKFKKYYVGAKITFDGTVSKIETKTENCNDATRFIRNDSELKTTDGKSYKDENKCVVIYFKEGFTVFIPSTEMIDIADVNEDDKYHVESNIGGLFAKIACFGIDSESENKSVDFYLTKISKIN